MQASKGVPLSDPALDRPRLKTDMCKNVDLPMSAFAINHLYSVPVETVPRPGFNTTGKEVELSLNAYPITKFPSRTVYQYDVHIGTGLEKFIVNKKVWNSRARRAALKSIVYDGSKLAWSMNLYKTEFNEEINLDVEEGRPVRKGIEKDKNTFRLLVRHTRTVNLAVLNAWLSGQASFDDGVLEAMNFLDHVLREHPSSQLLAIKRSFFDENGGKGELGGGVIALKGMYQSIRPAIGGRLIVNVDVSNTCFWARISLTGAALEICDARDHQHLCHLLRPKPDGYGGVTESELFQEVSRRLRKLVVAPFYGGCPVLGVRFTVKGLINGNARQYMVDIKDKATGKINRMSVEQYFKTKYNLVLNDWALPMVEMTKKDVVYPMEVLTIQGLQRFPFKLNETQTAQMIKYAASRPKDRLETILTSKRTLAHDQDPVLNNFGLKISNTMMKTKARLLPSPAVMFGNNQRIEPGVSGRWDLRGKKFYTANPQPLQAWGIGYFPGRRNVISNDQVVRFADNFMKTYAGHGGTITRRPVIIELKEDIGEAIKKLYEGAGKANQEDPQLLLVIVPDKNSFTYTRIKKSCDCRWGVPSQVLQAGHVNRGNPQYVSNVLMKVNAKLGGVTSRAVSKVQGATLRPGSMIIGADVTHPPMGVWSPSMAAVSVSKDPYGSSYFGACEANMDRIEIISRTSMEFMLAPLVREWITTIGQGRAPKYVYYFRDGVSSGQFEHVLNQEVINIKSVITQHNMNQWDGKITVVVANKRHHLRAFPKSGDRNAADKNGNPLPGILIEKDVTSPHDWDFLLYSHIALQGTSRPVHYHVILDQIEHKPHELQNMIYDHCYQYIRSTTSVSLYPAIYYAHLIASRARSHEDVPASSGPQSGNTIKLTNPKPKNRPVDPKLLPIINRRNRLPWQMWYI